MKLSAGILLYRRGESGVEVFLVHPGGPFWAQKDTASWSIPKGEYQETDDPLAAAQREFQEETGQPVPVGERVALGDVKYGNKSLRAWAIEGQAKAGAVTSNMFAMQWPPRSGQTQEFPEVDKAQWYDLATARQKLVAGQVLLVDRLTTYLGGGEV